MTARATFKQSELDRAAKTAKRMGFALRIEGGAINLLPIANEAPPSSPESDDDAWQRAMGRWRRSE